MVFGQKKWVFAHFQKQKWPQKSVALQRFFGFCPLSHFYFLLNAKRKIVFIYKIENKSGHLARSLKTCK
jgi:hypothetical protein